ncbi:MAG: transposase [Armatimonadetes bacterium]|nr:transposase [Armatimonadota bacterium]
MKCFRYRLYPTRAQETALNATLDTLRLVYNSLLNERKFLYETTGKGVSQYAQEKHFAEWRRQFPELAQVHSHLLQNAALRVNLAFTAFFRRVKNGEKPGFPRFKGVGQYDSLMFKEWGNGVSFKSGKLYVSKVGHVKGKFHRPTEGTPKTATVRRQAGKWFVCIACEVSPEPLPTTHEAIGIDVGLKTFAALSDGTFIENPRFFRRDENALAKAQRKLAKQKRGSRARRKARKVVARIHERVRNRRHDFCHQNARRLVNRFGVIAVEKLNVRGMVRNGHIAKSISDAAWSQFRECLTQKAESAAREVHAVDPAHTSQDCHQCGHRAKKTLSERWHLCPMCGASLDRDTNAAINILNRIGATMRGRYTDQEAVGL